MKYFLFLIKIIFEPFKLTLEKFLLENRNQGLNLLGKNKLNNVVFKRNNVVVNSSLNNCKIDDYSYVGSDSNINNCIIKKFTSIGPNVKIGLGEHPSRDFLTTHPTFYSDNKPFKTFADKTYFKEYSYTTIGNDVWIGANSVIKGGVVIGDGAIIASGSVVTKDVDPYSILGGVPAKHIRYRFSDSDLKKIKQFEWWDADFEFLSKNHKLFNSIDNIEILLNDFKNK